MTPIQNRFRPGQQSVMNRRAAAGFQLSDPWFLAFMARLVQAVAMRAASDWKEHTKAVTDSGQEFLEESRDDLARWSGLLASGALLEKDFRWLTRSRSELLKVRTLGQVGMSVAQIDRFRSILVETIVATALVFFLDPDS